MQINAGASIFRLCILLAYICIYTKTTTATTTTTKIIKKRNFIFFPSDFLGTNHTGYSERTIIALKLSMAWERKTVTKRKMHTAAHTHMNTLIHIYDLRLTSSSIQSME